MTNAYSYSSGRGAQGSPLGASSRSGSRRSVEQAAAACAAAYGAGSAASATPAGRRGFGEPASRGAAERTQALSVSAAMALAKGALEGVTVRLVGEVSELSNKPGYKAVYFTVKDKSASLPCMMWNNRYRAAGVQMRVGQLVELTGRFTLYAAKGRMNFDVFSVALAGEGNLRLQVANLARKLEAEGLMDPARKLPVPAFPLTVGLVTSPRGDAVHDVLRTLRRRFPVARVLLAGVAVEGPQAAAGIVEGMRAVVHAGAEVVLVVRGGGSYEDLMPFNDEFLARMIVKCPVPVVTGIGHEPDTSIADMVADLRASTPTAAAEKVSPARESLDALFAARAGSLQACAQRSIEHAGVHLGRAAAHPVFRDRNALLASASMGVDLASDRLTRALPASLDKDRSRVARLQERLATALPNAVGDDAVRLEHLRDRFVRAFPLRTQAAAKDLARERDRLARVLPAATRQLSGELSHKRERLASAGSTLTQPFAQQFGVAAAQLDALSPLAVLGRGYAIARNDAGAIVKSVEAAPVGSRVDVSVADGVLACRVEGQKPASPESDSRKDA